MIRQSSKALSVADKKAKSSNRFINFFYRGAAFFTPDLTYPSITDNLNNNKKENK